MQNPSNATVRWVPSLGEFEIRESDVLFRGKMVPTTSDTTPAEGEPEQRAGVGLALSNLSLADGFAEADVRFDEITPDSICELAVAYDSNAKHVVTAGLGGEPWAMFGIREFGGTRQGWWDHRMGGDRANLKAGNPYHVRATFRGATVTLSIDGVNVVLARPQPDPPSTLA